MTRPPRSPPESETPDPAFERPGDAGVRRDAVWLIAQQIHELASDFARNATKTDRLIADVETLSKDVKALSGALTFAKGFGACAVLLVPASAWPVWWLIGGKLNDIRDEMYHARPAVYGAPSPVAPQPGERTPR